MSHRPISAAYLERKLRAIVGVQGSNPLPDLEDVTGLVTLEDDRLEWRLAGGELLWAIHRNVAAVVGQQGFVGVWVPQGAGVISVVTHIQVSNSSGAAANFDLHMVFPAVTPTGDGITFTRDSRAAATIPATRRFSGTSAAPLVGNVIERRVIPTVVADDYHAGIVLASSPITAAIGSGIELLCIGANVAVDATIWGYERPLEGTVEVK